MGIGAAIGGIVGGIASSRGASKAADAQAEAARQQTELEKYIYEDTKGRFAPFYDSNLDFQNILHYELLGGDVPIIGGTDYDIEEIQVAVNDPQGSGRGTPPLDPRVWIDPYGPRTPNNLVRNERGADHTISLANSAPPSMVTKYRVGGQEFGTMAEAQKWAKDNRGGFQYQGFKASPGYKFALDQGQTAIDGSAAARGNVFSGATLKAQQEFGTGLAQQEYGNFLNRLTGQASQGQAAAGNIATAGSNYASGAGNALANMGNAQAAGYIGQANALNGAINNGLTAWGYMKSPSANMMTASNGISIPRNTMNSVQALF